MAEGAAKILHGRKPLTVLVALAPELAKLGILAEDPVDRCVRSRLQGGRWLEWMGGDPLVNFSVYAFVYRGLPIRRARTSHAASALDASGVSRFFRRFDGFESRLNEREIVDVVQAVRPVVRIIVVERQDARCAHDASSAGRSQALFSGQRAA